MFNFYLGAFVSDSISSLCFQAWQIHSPKACLERPAWLQTRRNQIRWLTFMAETPPGDFRGTERKKIPLSTCRALTAAVEWCGRSSVSVSRRITGDSAWPHVTPGSPDVCFHSFHCVSFHVKSNVLIVSTQINPPISRMSRCNRKPGQMSLEAKMIQSP